MCEEKIRELEEEIYNLKENIEWEKEHIESIRSSLKFQKERVDRRKKGWTDTIRSLEGQETGHLRKLKRLENELVAKKEERIELKSKAFE